MSITVNARGSVWDIVVHRHTNGYYECQAFPCIVAWDGHHPDPGEFNYRIWHVEHRHVQRAARMHLEALIDWNRAGRKA